jgi:uncharacterized protein (TIGR03066 family)
MHTISGFLTSVMFLSGITLTFAAPVPLAPKPLEKKPQELLLGVWKLTKTDTELPEDAQVELEFTTNQKLYLTFWMNNNQRLTREGTYKLDGLKLTYTLESSTGSRSETLTIKKLTETELHVIDPEEKNEYFTRLDPKSKPER